MGFADFFKKKTKYDESDGLIIDVEQKHVVPKVEPKAEQPVQKAESKPGFVVESSNPDATFFNQKTTFLDSKDSLGAWPTSTQEGSYEFGPKDNTGKWPEVRKYTPFEKPIRYETRPLIVIAVENTSEVCEYYADIVALLKKIVADNKDAFFLFLRMGENKKYFDILHHDKLKENNLPDCILSDKVDSEVSVKLSEALEHVYEAVKQPTFLPLRLKHNGKDYEISGSKIIVIGSGKIDCISSDQNQSCEFVKSICNTKSVKAFKYFCLKDRNAINAAKIGFPEIGHIDYIFYE